MIGSGGEMPGWDGPGDGFVRAGVSRFSPGL